MCILDRMNISKDLKTHSFTNGYVTDNDNGELHHESVRTACMVKQHTPFLSSFMYCLLCHPRDVDALDENLRHAPVPIHILIYITLVFVSTRRTYTTYILIYVIYIHP